MDSYSTPCPQTLHHTQLGSYSFGWVPQFKTSGHPDRKIISETILFFWLCGKFGRWVPLSETLHHFWCETFTVIVWLTTYDYWLLLRNFAPVLVWNFYGDCLTDYLRLLAFGAKLLRWLSDDAALWLLGYRKNDWDRSNSRWQAPTSAEKEHVISLALKSKGCCHSIFENTESIAFYTATERSSWLFALRR